MVNIPEDIPHLDPDDELPGEQVSYFKDEGQFLYKFNITAKHDGWSDE